MDELKHDNVLTGSVVAEAAEKEIDWAKIVRGDLARIQILPSGMTFKQIIPDDVRAGLIKLVMKCPECRGYGRKGGAFAVGPREDCPICTSVRKWLWEEFKIATEELT